MSFSDKEVWGTSADYKDGDEADGKEDEWDGVGVLEEGGDSKS